jgi:O-antigen/teichoic acid export membrane protein
MKNTQFGRFLSLFLGKLGKTFIFIIGLPILARLLSPRGFGDYAIIYSFFSVGILIVSAGLPDGLRRQVTATSDQHRAGIIGFYFRYGIFSAAGTLVAIWVLVKTGAIGVFYPPRFNNYFLILSLILVTYLSFELVAAVMMAESREKQSEILRVLNRLIAIGGGILLVMRGFEVTGVFISFVIAGAATSVIGLYFIQDSVRLSAIFAPDLPGTRTEFLSYSSIVMLQGALETVLWNSDLILLGIFINGESAGYYKAALSIGEFLWLAPFALQTFLSYNIAEYWKEGNTEKINEIIQKVTRYTVLLLVLLVVGIYTTGGSFVELYYGPKYTEAIKPLYILVPGAFCYALIRPTIGVQLAHEKPRMVVIATALSALLNIILNILLIPRFQLAGAAAATSISYGLMLVFQLVAASRSHGIRTFSDIRIFRLLLSAATVYLALSWFNSIADHLLVEVVGSAIIGGCAFIVLIIVTGTVTRSEIQFLINQAR